MEVRDNLNDWPNTDSGNAESVQGIADLHRGTGFEGIADSIWGVDFEEIADSIRETGFEETADSIRGIDFGESAGSIRGIDFEESAGSIQEIDLEGTEVADSVPRMLLLGSVAGFAGSAWYSEVVVGFLPLPACYLL